jgi:hypothetical protein
MGNQHGNKACEIVENLQLGRILRFVTCDLQPAFATSQPELPTYGFGPPACDSLSYREHLLRSCIYFSHTFPLSHFQTLMMPSPKSYFNASNGQRPIEQIINESGELMPKKGPVTDYGSTMVNWMRHRQPHYKGSYLGELERPSISYMIHVSILDSSENTLILTDHRCSLPQRDLHTLLRRFLPSISIHRSIRSSILSMSSNGLQMAEDC